MATSATRLRVIGLYKELQRLGRDYPDPSYVTASPPTKGNNEINGSREIYRYDYQGRMRRLFESAYCVSFRREIEVHTMRGNRQQASQDGGRDQSGDKASGIRKARFVFFFSYSLLRCLLSISPHRVNLNLPS